MKRGSLVCLAIVGVLALTATAFGSGVDSEAIAQWQLANSQVEFPGGTLGKAMPMYSPKLEGPAFIEYEVVAPDGSSNGYIVVAATNNTVPVVEYSDDTLSHYRRFYDMLGHTDFRMVYYGYVYTVAESPSGEMLAEIGEMPPILMTDLKKYDGPKELEAQGNAFSEPVEIDASGYPLEYYWPKSYEEFRSMYKLANHLTNNIDERWERLSESNLEYSYYYPGGTRCDHGQIPTSTCYTGCGPTAWVNVYCWWERAKGKTNLFCGTPPTCNVYDGCVSPVIWNLVGYVGTYCIGNNGATNPWNIYKGYKHADAKGYWWSYWWHWRIPGLSYSTEADILRSAGQDFVFTVVGYYDDWHYGAGQYYKVGSGSDVSVEIVTGWGGCIGKLWVPASDTMAVVKFNM